MSDRTITPTQDVTVATEADHQEMPRAPDTYGPRWFNYNAFSDDDIASEFGVALAKLEELLYAVYGALPDYANDELWYHRANPRALWPEQKTTWVGYGPVQERYDYHQYPATGYVTGLALHSDQQIGARVPIRSRSGDPQLQYVMAEHEPEFGRGTVERDYSASPHDPPNDQAVEVRWSPPPGTSVESATLRTNRGSHTMTEDNGTWRAAADAEDQGTWVGWYIEGSVDRGGDLPETIYEPKTPTGVDPTYRTPPSDEHERLTDSAYTWVSFTHTLGPYAYGLPEQITRLGDTESSPPGLKKSTETWEFDKFENIQCAHVNLARFALDQLGRDLQHSPHQRGNDENCCFNMPIKWRWSGSNVPWQYVGGGKGGTSEVQPLHNLEENAGSGAARRSWRGMPMLFKDDPFESGWPVNFSYGGDESWGAPYADVWSDVEVRDEYHVGLMYDAGLKAGLQPGDAIDRTHLLEIIAAVDYLITKGCWRTATIHSARMSPMTAFG
ncbi:MAG: hypothetical protein GY842_06305, partial [bacterium]|nr:hypothetical protein [bacterium]